VKISGCLASAARKAAFAISIRQKYQKLTAAKAKRPLRNGLAEKGAIEIIVMAVAAARLLDMPA